MGSSTCVELLSEDDDARVLRRASVSAWPSATSPAAFPILVCSDGVMSVFYQLVKLGWFPLPTSSGGLLPLRGVSLSGDLGLSTAEASDIRFSGDVMAFGHLVRPARSASKLCVGIAGVPLWVPLKICVFSSGGWSASTRLFRPSATRTSGRSLQGRGCIFCICQGCLCKRWNVNHHNYV